MRGGEGRGGRRRERTQRQRQLGPPIHGATNPPIACVDTIWQHPTEKKMKTIGKRIHSRYWPKTLLVSL